MGTSPADRQPLLRQNQKQQQQQRSAGDYVPLPLIGKIKEKGFSSSPAISSSERVSVPQPRVTPFPVARHRSEGPHWTPLPLQSFQATQAAEDDLDDMDGDNLAVQAQPIQRRPKRGIEFSRWKLNADIKMDENLVESPVVRDSGKVQQPMSEVKSSLQLQRQDMTTNGTTAALSRATETDTSLSTATEHDTSQAMIGSKIGNESGSYVGGSGVVSVISGSRQGKGHGFDQLGLQLHSEGVTNFIDRNVSVSASSQGDTMSLKEEIDTMNQATLQSMTEDEIAEAQMELANRLRPELIEMLKKRGRGKTQNHDVVYEKAKANIMEATEHTPLATSSLATNDEDTIMDDATAAAVSERQTPDTIPSITRLEAPKTSSERRSWSDRVEAVRSLRFGLDGNALPTSLSTVVSSLNDADPWNVHNVTERDLLRTEGDPVADGYTLKEAVALTRSVVPAQRAAALRMLAKILDKSMSAFHYKHVSERSPNGSVDWQAIWAYALGPEPELVVHLRIALDDSHATVVATCARALESLLSCFLNEKYFNLCELLWTNDAQLFTAPIFRKPSFQDEGLVGGGRWKYNVKSSDMFPFSSNNDSQNTEGDGTVKDDASIANQDVAAGLIRMGVLPRIRYILEVEQLAAAEEALLNILIALARHSPTGADSVMSCPRLLDTILKCFSVNQNMGFNVWQSLPKAIRLLQVLALAKKENCLHFFEMGLVQASQFGLLQQGLALSQQEPAYQVQPCLWMGLVESLRFWRTCIHYQLGISFFYDLYPALLFWISPAAQPFSRKNNENLNLTESSFLLLETLARTLPVLHTANQPEDQRQMKTSLSELPEQDERNWSWKYAIPAVETSLGWLSSEVIQACVQRLKEPAVGDYGGSHVLRVLASVLHFLSTVCERIQDGKINQSQEFGLIWLPTFVPKLGLQIVKSGLLGFIRSAEADSVSPSKSFVGCFLSLEESIHGEVMLEVTNCLHGLVRLLKELDNLLTMSRVHRMTGGDEQIEQSAEAEILEDGLLRAGQRELMRLLSSVGNTVIFRSRNLQIVDASGRGGPAPGVGIGWGCLGGGYWSEQVLTAQTEVAILTKLLTISFSYDRISRNVKALIIPDKNYAYLDGNGTSPALWNIKVCMSATALVGPANADLLLEVCSSILFEENTLSRYVDHMDRFLRQWLHKVGAEDYQQISDSWLSNLHSKVKEIGQSLLCHLQSLWLQKKVKSTSNSIKPTGSKQVKEGKKRGQIGTLPTVDEDTEMKSTRYEGDILAGEWAGQRLPLPLHWWLSPLLYTGDLKPMKTGNTEDLYDLHERTGIMDVSSLKAMSCSSDQLEVVRHGLLFLCGLEALTEECPDLIFCVNPAIKLHALSNVFLLSDDIFLEKEVRFMIGGLQELYGCHSLLSSAEVSTVKGTESNQSCLDFVSMVDERYPSFIERLSNQFAAVSFGDIVFGRQIAFYLRRDVPEALRMRVWKVLETEHVLGLLPPLERCCGPFSAYLYPYEENMEALKMFASSWTSGALDGAMLHNSVSFTLAIFHIANYIFQKDANPETAAGKKSFTRNLILGLMRRRQFQDFLVKLLKCDVQAQKIEDIFEAYSSIETEGRCSFLEEVFAESKASVAEIGHLRQMLNTANEEFSGNL